MATNEGLNFKIGAEVDELLKGISDAKKAMADLSTATNNEANAADAAGKKWNQMGKYIFQLNYERKRMIQQVQQGIGTWKLEAKAIDEVANKSLSNFRKQTVNAGATLTSVSRIFQDAPYGIQGWGNNLTNAAENVQYLIQRTGSLEGAMKSLGKSIIGTGGIIAGISLLTSAATYLTQKYGSLGNAITQIFDTLSEAEKRQKALRDAIEGSADAYQDAVSMVEELKTNIDLAKKGLIDKEKVVNQYNNSIGKTTGSVKNLDEAEKALVKNADAFIKFTLLKAAAQLALDEAAKKAFEAELKRQKEAREFVAFSDRSFSSTAQFGGLEAKTAEKLRKERGEIRKKEAIKESEDAKKTFEDIAKKLQADAAAISAQYKFDFFGGDQNSTKKEIKATRKVAVKYEAYELNTIEEAINQSKRQDLIFKPKPIEAKVPIDISLINIPQARQKLVSQIKEVIAPANEAARIEAQKIGMTITNSINQSLQGIVLEGITTLGDIIGSYIAGSEGGVKEAIKSFVGVLGGYMQNLGKEMIVFSGVLKGIQVSISSLNPAVAAIAGVAAIAAGSALKAYASKMPSFATGGGVFQPTMAMIGDNPGREEYVIPSEVLDKLGGGNGGFIAETMISGNDLRILVRKADVNYNRGNG